MQTERNSKSSLTSKDGKRTYTKVGRLIGYRDLTDSEKLLLGYIEGWAGCKVSNAYIARELDTTGRSTRRRIEHLKAKGYILVRGEGKARTMWAKSDVKTEASMALWDEKHQTNPAISGHVEKTNLATSGHPTRPPVATNDNTNENTTNKRTLLEKNNSAFEKFWLAYPKKVSKQSALKAWGKISPDKQLFDKIMVALKRHKQQDGWNKDSGQFIPHPASWLNQRRWEDEIQSRRPATPPLQRGADGLTQLERFEQKEAEDARTK